MNQTTTPKPRRMAPEQQQPQAEAQSQADSSTSCEDPTPVAKAPSRLGQLQALLTRPVGATIAEMVEATGWQQHSVRGAMAGALKKRGLTITSEKIDGNRRYRSEAAA